MGAVEDEVRITVRDIYDMLQEHDAWERTQHESYSARLNAHEVHDAERFSRLNVKVYGVLAGIVTSGAALLLTRIGP